MGHALYCLKLGCAVTGTGASFIAGGIAYDELLADSGRPRVFLPMMGQIFNGVFGEVPNTQGNNNNQPRIPAALPRAKQQDIGTVTEMVQKYQSMSPEDRIDFMVEVNSSFEDDKNERNKK